MTRAEMMDEIRRRSDFPFDFSRASDADLAEMLRDMNGDGDRFSVTEPVTVERHTADVR